MATNENYQYGIADQENVNPSPSNLTITHLTPELTTVTLAVGESMWIRIEDISREDYGQLYWSTSEKEHVQVNQGGTITAVNPGEATITVKAGRNSRIAAKVKVYVIPDSSYYSSYASRLLPIAISDQVREILRNDFNIIDNDSFIRKYKDPVSRQELIYGLKVSEADSRRMFRETLLAAVPGMTTSFGFYAAAAGVRNIWDLARVSILKITSVINILYRSLRMPEGVSLTRPTHEEITVIVRNAGSMIGTACENYCLVLDDDPEPAYLFDNNRFFRTDSDILSESFSFMQNMEVNLPLPRTISGIVKMREKNLLGQMEDVPKPGYFVQISGISSPAQDKVEDEEDLCAYTDGDGRFCIVMPDRYNLQETVKITVYEKAGDGYGVVRSRTVADTLPRMVFVRRASEVLESEVIRIKRIVIVPDENGEPTRVVREKRFSWAGLLEAYNLINTLQMENITLERKIRMKIAAHARIDKNDEEIRIRRRRLRLKYEFIRDQLERYLKNREKAYENGEDEENNIRINGYLDALKRLGPDIRKELDMWQNRMDVYLQNNRTPDDRVESYLAAARERFDKISEVTDELANGNISAIEALYDDPYFAECLEEAKKSISEKLEAIRKDKDTETNELDPQQIKEIREDIEELNSVIKVIERDLSVKVYGGEYADEADRPDIYGISLSEISDAILGHSDEVAEQIRQELMILLAEQDQIGAEIAELEVTDSFEMYLETQTEDVDVIKYLKNKEIIEENICDLYGDGYDKGNLSLAIKRLFSRSLDADLGDFILIREMFEGSSLKPRALPSVRLMGEGDTAVYLPTDTAPSRIFNYKMLQRLIEPAFSVDGGKTEGKRKKLSGMLDVSAFKKKFYTDLDSVPVAVSLGMGYVLNMHQAWVPDGFALGKLLYSLVLAPGEEQRIIVREHKENYTVSDEATALDTIRDTYTNNQQDNESAAFNNAANRYSAAHSDYEYYSSAKSKGKTSLGFCFGIGVSSSSSSTNKGSGSSNASQNDTYSEVSQAAQSFQSEIKTESERIAAANRTSIRIASSEESESVASRIIANHNHSHVMTIQYWEVMRRYRMETCIEDVELVLFVPMKPVRFLPVMTSEWAAVLRESYEPKIEEKIKIPSALRWITKNDTDTKNITIPSYVLKEAYGGYEMKYTSLFELNKDSFAFRYSEILRHADVLAGALPLAYRGGLNLVKKYAAYPEWKMEKRAGKEKQSITLELTGYFLEFDNIVATLHFANSDVRVVGTVTARDFLRLDPSLNTREDVVYGIRKLREGESVRKVQNKIKKYEGIDIIWGVTVKVEEDTEASTDEEKAEAVSKPVWKFTFAIPSYVSIEDLDHISVENHISGWSCRLSQAEQYLEQFEIDAITRYEEKMHDLYSNGRNTEYDEKEVERISRGLPECYTSPIVNLTSDELKTLGALELKVNVKKGPNDIEFVPESIRLQYSAETIDLSKHVPVLRYNEVLEIEKMFHHVLSDTMYYSQVIWASLTDDERIMLLEPYTVDMDYALWYGEDDSEAKQMNDSKIPLLNCVNAKRLIGFYGNCMLLPFTYPQKLADILGKTAADVQEELYRFHTTSFRVPSTVISVPTDGMVGEAVLGATNVSEKVDITRFWNWKDSEIDHMDINQNALGGRSLLENASTMRVDAPTQGVAPTVHIDNSGLAQALASRAQPTFADVLANTDMRDLIMNADNNASKGRESIVEANSAVLTSALEAASSIGSAALSGGISGLTKNLGDKEILKSALGEIGMSDDSISSMIDKVDSGDMSMSDFAQNIANSVKKQKDKDKPGNSEGRDNSDDIDPGGRTGSGNDHLIGGNTDIGSTQKPNNDTKNPTGETNPEQNDNSPSKTETSKRNNVELTEEMIEYFNKALEAAVNGESSESFYCRMTGSDLSKAHDEIMKYSNEFCSEKGIDDLAGMINSLVMNEEDGM